MSGKSLQNNEIGGMLKAQSRFDVRRSDAPEGILRSVQ
jgi:hypothetical protein